MDNNQPQQQSQFNMAIEHLRVIRQLQNKADESSILSDADTWSKVLLTLYREISTYMNKQQRNDITIKYIIPLHQLLQKNTNTNQQGKKRIIGELYTLLHQFDIELRLILDDGGLLTKRVDDATKSLR